MSFDLATHAPAGLALVTRDWQMLECNATLAAWLGETREELRDRSLRTFFSVAGQIFVETHVDPLLAMQGQVREVALEIVRPRQIPVLLNADATPDGLHLALLDVHDRRSYEEELRTSRLRAEAEAARHALVADVAPRLVGVLGVQDTLDVAAADAVPRLADACVVHVRAQDVTVRAEAGPATLLEALALDDPPSTPGRNAVYPLGEDGRLGRIAFVWGVAKEPDQALLREYAHLVALAVDRARLHEEARQEVKAREILIGILAHEFANPLSALHLQATVVRRIQQGPLPDHVERLVQVLERNVGQMDRLVKDMMDLSRIRSGLFAIAPQQADLAEVARATVEGMQPFLSTHGVRVEVEAAPAPCFIDAGRLQQVLSNLITNAVKYGAAPYLVQVEKEADYVRLRVIDHGPGISAEDRDRLFDAFERLGRTSQGGTGLGLYIVRHMVAAHHGDIDVQETPGGGTTFSISLPATAAP